jgi:hypothetical protein
MLKLKLNAPRDKKEKTIKEEVCPARASLLTVGYGVPCSVYGEQS